MVPKWHFMGRGVSGPPPADTVIPAPEPGSEQGAAWYLGLPVRADNPAAAFSQRRSVEEDAGGTAEPEGQLLPGKASVIVGDDLLRAPANLRAEGALTPNRSCAWAAKQARESKQETATIK